MATMKVGDKVFAQEATLEKWLPGVIIALDTQLSLYWVQFEGYKGTVPRAKGEVKPFQDRRRQRKQETRHE